MARSILHMVKYQTQIMNVLNNVVCKSANLRLFSTDLSRLSISNSFVASSLFRKQMAPCAYVYQISRNYGPKVPKGKMDSKGKKGGKPKVQLSQEELEKVIDVQSLKEQLDTAVENLKKEYIKQLTLRTSVGALETLPVKLDGEEYPLNQIAHLSRKSPQLLVINASSMPEAVKAIVDSISESGMDLNPQQEGTTVSVTIPKVTKEHREKLAKTAKLMFQNTKMAIQAIQNNFIKEAKKQKELSEDLVFNTQQQIVYVAEEHISEAEKLMASKQKELLSAN